MAETAADMTLQKPGEACGVFGIYGPDLPLASLTYKGLQAVQNRGQQGAGISISGGESIMIMTDLGLVREAFSRGKKLSGFLSNGLLATGHVRYATSHSNGVSAYDMLQPLHFTDERDPDLEFTLGHNGHLTYDDEGNWNSDSDRLLHDIGASYLETRSLRKALHRTLPGVIGAYSLVLSTETELFAARDPYGFRPLHIGRIAKKGWVVASEIAALRVVNAKPVREVEPGELVIIRGAGDDDMFTEQFVDTHKEQIKPALCGFEYVYFSRPDNVMHGENVEEVRERMGRLLARREPVEAEMVIGVPDSGLAAADGYSWASNIPHRRNRLVRNNYVDRNFIKEDGERKNVRDKLNTNDELIEGMRVVVVDDSIVRGDTQKELVAMLREAGAAEVHVRISSPPYKWPCFYGMDTGRREELLAANMSVKQICEYIGADSLAFLTDEDIQEAVGQAAGKICTACTTGIYPSNPVPVTLQTHKNRLPVNDEPLLVAAVTS